MSSFEKNLSLWVALAISVGVLLGKLFPQFFIAVAALEWAHVNGMVATLIWLMIFPMMLRVDFNQISKASSKPQGFLLTVAINWLVKPFTMAGLGILFFRYLYTPWVSANEGDQFLAGMILLGVAPCTAMVFVWSDLVRGNAEYTLIQVAVNDLIMVFAFAPIAGFLLGVTKLEVPWGTLLLSTLHFVVIPLMAGIICQRLLRPSALELLSRRLKPWTAIGLLLTVILLFGFQADTLIQRPLQVGLVAIPLLIQSMGIFAIAYLLARAMKLPFEIAAPAALIGTSNFFELAVAVAVGLFGLNSEAALATVVGVLIEVPVMLLLVKLSNQTRHWFHQATNP